MFNIQCSVIRLPLSFRTQAKNIAITYVYIFFYLSCRIWSHLGHPPSEVQQDLHYYWNREFAGKKIPYRPDALLEMEDGRYYIEFDTGSESNGRLRNRFNNCLKLYNNVTDPKQDRLPNEIVWVCRTEKRKQRIEQIATEILQDYKSDQMKKILKDLENDTSLSTKERQNEINKRFAVIRIPTSYCFIEGDDTKFLLGEIEAVPFWQQEE